MIGRIYKIVHNQSDLCYVGSTFNTLRGRWTSHKSSTNSCVISKHIQEHGAENFKIMLIKEYDVVDRKHLLAYESLWISKTKCINGCNPFRVPVLYRKQYYTKNKERIEQYNLDNRDTILERKRRYREANKDKINAYTALKGDYYKEKIKCETCNCEVSRNKMPRHNKCLKHLNNLKKKQSTTLIEV